MPSISNKSSEQGQPTIREVSRKAGVSTATVSRVLAGLGGASDATHRKVRDAAKSLGYQPNRMASGLRTTRSKVVGVVIPDLQNPFFTGIVGGVEEALRELGYSLFLANSGDDLERERSELTSLRTERVSGILIIPCEADAAHYETLPRLGVPVVAIDRVPEGVPIDSVTCANEKGAFEAVGRLIESGHREIGLINGPSRFQVAREREAGYVAALKKAGIRKRVSWMASGDFQSDSGYMLTRKILAAKDRPRAIFVGNFMMALGALRAIRELKLRIPEDVGLVTFDDMPWAAAMSPPISVVAQPVRELGRTAAKLLLERIEDPERTARKIVLDPELIVRESCGMIAKEDVG